MILDELIPWRRNFDFSTLEVNRLNVSVLVLHREIGNVCGFSRETLIAVTMSREAKRNMEEGLPPEHPRASTTDGVECMLRDCV